MPDPVMIVRSTVGSADAKPFKLTGGSRVLKASRVLTKCATAAWADLKLPAQLFLVPLKLRAVEAHLFADLASAQLLSQLLLTLNLSGRTQTHRRPYTMAHVKCSAFSSQKSLEPWLSPPFALEGRTLCL